MSKLTAEIKACGLCSSCGVQQVTAISEAEAKKIVEVVKAEIIMAVNNVGLSSDDEKAVTQSIRNVE